MLLEEKCMSHYIIKHDDCCTKVNFSTTTDVYFDVLHSDNHKINNLWLLLTFSCGKGLYTMKLCYKIKQMM